MHRKSKPARNRRLILIIAASALSVIVAACLVVLLTGSSGGNGNVQMQSVAQPASAAQIAQNLHCTGFKDLGAAAILSNDSGSCFIGTKKYAINTFPNKAARDSWLESATQLGVVPKWETDTSVTYPSVS